MVAAVAAAMLEPARTVATAAVMLEMARTVATAEGVAASPGWTAVET